MASVSVKSDPNLVRQQVMIRCVERISLVVRESFSRPKLCKTQACLKQFSEISDELFRVSVSEFSFTAFSNILHGSKIFCSAKIEKHYMHVVFGFMKAFSVFINTETKIVYSFQKLYKLLCESINKAHQERQFK